MDLTPIVEDLRRDFAATADVAGPEASAVAGRLMASLDSAIRLALLDALSTAAEEITRELAPGAVEVRLRGREPEFVVTPPTRLEPPAPPPPPPPPMADGDESGTARISLRLPESLKSQVDAMAAAQVSSVNAWLVDAVTRAVAGLGDNEPRGRRAGHTDHGRRIQGWVR
jgi:hypothetical protein